MPTIDTSNIKPNSHAYKAEAVQNKEKERPKIEAVVKGGVVSTKESGSKKFLKRFFDKDADDLAGFVISDVIIPGIKNAILDVLSMAFFGESVGKSYHGKKLYSSYSSMYDMRKKERERSYGSRDSGYAQNEEVDYRQIVLRDIRDAEAVVYELQKRIDLCGYATVADLFGLVKIPGQYTDNNWGWDKIEDIGIRRVAKGFLIKVSEAQYIKG